MEKGLRDARISVIAHTIAAVLVAYFSLWIQNNVYAGVVGLVVLIAVGYPLERLTGKRGFKWWLANGIVLYLLVWLVGWIYLFNT